VAVRWALDACVAVRWHLSEVALAWQCGGPGRSRGGDVAPG
jgi:hypothetical protein